MDLNRDFHDGFKHKQVPTDDEIGLYANDYIKFQEPQSFYDTYVDGYKQALIDLGLKTN